MFSFDPSDVKKVSVSTDSLDKAMEDPILPQITTPLPSTTEVSVRRRKTDRERRFSAPPSERRSTRDSVGSLDYLSESQGKYKVGGDGRRSLIDSIFCATVVDSDDEESVQSEVSFI